MDSPGGEPPEKPNPLNVRKDSYKIKKPPLPLPQRTPITTYVVEPKTIHIDKRDFMSLVQKLTGLPRADGEALGPGSSVQDQRGVDGGGATLDQTAGSSSEILWPARGFLHELDDPAFQSNTASLGSTFLPTSDYNLSRVPSQPSPTADSSIPPTSPSISPSRYQNFYSSFPSLNPAFNGNMGFTNFSSNAPPTQQPPMIGSGSFPGTLPRFPSSLQPATPNLYSPTLDPNSYRFLAGLNPAFQGNYMSSWCNPTNSSSPPPAQPSPSAYGSFTRNLSSSFNPINSHNSMHGANPVFQGNMSSVESTLLTTHTNSSSHQSQPSSSRGSDPFLPTSNNYSSTLSSPSGSLTFPGISTPPSSPTSTLPDLFPPPSEDENSHKFFSELDKDLDGNSWDSIFWPSASPSSTPTEPPPGDEALDYLLNSFQDYNSPQRGDKEHKDT